MGNTPAVILAWYRSVAVEDRDVRHSWRLTPQLVERWSRLPPSFDAAPQIPVYSSLPFSSHRPVVGKNVMVKPQRHLFLNRCFLGPSLPTSALDDLLAYNRG